MIRKGPCCMQLGGTVSYLKLRCLSEGKCLDDNGPILLSQSTPEMTDIDITHALAVSANQGRGRRQWEEAVFGGHDKGCRLETEVDANGDLEGNNVELRDFAVLDV